LREKQIKRREQVVALQANVHRRASAKLDAIFKLLFAMVLLSLCLFLLQLDFGAVDIASGVAMRTVQLPTVLVIALALIIVISVLKLGLDDMSLALTADRREKAGDDFLKQHGSASAEVMHRFEDEWDFREFGVTSQDAPAVSTHERP
jgi:hypothetical protein